MSNETKACPYCGEEVLAVAVKCKHCKSYLDESVKPQPKHRHQSKSMSEDPVMRAVLPVGRSPYALLAGYAGLFSALIIGIPFAILFGILALNDIKKNPERVGKGRAWFGILSGGVFFFIFLIAFISS